MKVLCHVTKQSRDSFGGKQTENGSIPQNFYLVLFRLFTIYLFFTLMIKVSIKWFSSFFLKILVYDYLNKTVKYCFKLLSLSCQNLFTNK